MLDFSQVIYYCITTGVILLVGYLVGKVGRGPNQGIVSSPASDPEPDDFKDHIIGAVDPEFDWQLETPRPYRPFKAGKYHLTMGIKSCPVDDWLLLESTYQKVTEQRKKIVIENPEHTILVHPLGHSAVKEAYDMALNYMVKRYPKYFQIKKDEAVGTEYVLNTIKGTQLPLKSSAFNDGDIEMTRLIASNIEEDFLVLVLDEGEQQYYLRGGTFAFPSGFDPAKKINLSLKDIHGPVPLYKEKIQLSMDKYFSKLKVGQWVQRYNWSIQTHGELYAPSDNHASQGVKMKGLDPNTLDFSKVLLRCERQILTRMPHTKALLFTIRTYTSPLSQIREEGRAEDLIDAIDQLPESMAQYKMRPAWGEAVKSYMRRECEGKSELVT